MKSLRERNRIASRKYRKNHPERKRFIHIKHKFGLSKEAYEKMLLDQNNSCAICLERFVKTPHVDHCHKNKKIRSLLCGGCNHLLGYSRENTAILLNAVEYLKKHRSGNGEET